jgi:hypothetical protein
MNTWKHGLIGHMGTGTHGQMDSRIHAYLDTWKRGHVGHKDTCTYGYGTQTKLQETKRPRTQHPKGQNIQRGPGDKTSGET